MMVSIVLEMIEVIAVGRQLSGLDLSPFFGIGKTWACFHEVGNVPRV